MVKKRSNDISEKPKRPKARSPEDREKQLIALAVDLAEEQLRDGTASTQVITHYLKLGSTREAKEQEMLSEKTKLVSAQIESLESSKRIEELYEEAVKAMRIYSGEVTSDEDVL